MTAKDREDRILTLIIDKIFGTISAKDKKELNELLNHPDTDREKWEPLMEREKLMDFISSNFNEGNQSDLEKAKALFDKLTDKNE